MHKEICLAQQEKNENREVELLEHAIQEYPESSYLATYNLRLADLYLEKDKVTQAYHIYDNFALLHPTQHRTVIQRWIFPNIKPMPTWPTWQQTRRHISLWRQPISRNL